MLPLEHSAILLTCIEQWLVFNTIFVLFESGRFTKVLLYFHEPSKIVVHFLNVFMGKYHQISTEKTFNLGLLNQFKNSGFSNLYLLDESISNLRAVFSIFIQIPIAYYISK